MLLLLLFFFFIIIKRPHNESNIQDIDIARKMHYFERYDYQSPYWYSSWVKVAVVFH